MLRFMAHRQNIERLQAVCTVEPERNIKREKP